MGIQCGFQTENSHSATFRSESHLHTEVTERGALNLVVVLPGARAQVIGLHIAQRVAVGIGIETLPRAVTREVPGAGFIAHVDRKHIEQVLDMAGVFDPYERLDAAVEVAVHHIGRPDIDDGLARVLEREDTRVL